MGVIVMSKRELLARIGQTWDALQDFLGTLTDAQLTVPTDAAGWTVKDHMSHLAAWEAGVVDLLHGSDRREAMGMDTALWQAEDYDTMNSVIRRRYEHLSLAETRQRMQDVHARLVAAIAPLPDEALHPARSDDEAESLTRQPLINAIAGNTFDHYPEHQEWMAVIVKGYVQP